MVGRKEKPGSNTSRAKAEIDPLMASPRELPAKEIIKTPAAQLRELPTERYDPYLLFDDDDWQLLMNPAFCDNHGLAVRFARLLLGIKQAVEGGPEGVKRAGFTLLDGIRMAYKYTEEHQLAFRLFLLYLEGRLKAGDEPLQLIEAAIARADPESGSGC